MINAKYWIKRVWNKITNLPVVGKHLIRFSDKLQGILFVTIEKTLGEKHLNKFTRLKNLDEYFEFANQIFSSHQIKSEITGFLEFAKHEKPENILEIGTADGGTSFLLCTSLPSVKMIIGIDLLVKNSIKLKYFSQKFHFINASSHSETTVEKVRQILSGKELDILFIDGDHTYSGVKQDFLKYCNLVKEGGLIAFHDIIPDYYTRYGIKTASWVGDVPKFYEKIKAVYPHYEFVESREQDGLGIGVIRWSKSLPIPEDL